MSIASKIMQTTIGLAPDAPPDPIIKSSGPIGQPLPRLDGPLKVRGAAKFSAEYQLDDLAHAAIVCSTIARGKISALHTDEARKLPGVIEIITHENAPRMKAPPQADAGGQGKTSAADDIPILGGAEIFWDGQPIAIIVAETLDQAQAAAALVRVEYQSAPANLDFDALKGEAKVPDQILGEEPEIEIGDAEKALRDAAFAVDNLYRTPRYNHNAIEPHASIAHWNDGHLEVFDGSQYVFGLQNTLAAIFGVKPERVRARAPFVGGAFGGKGSVWQNVVLCAAAAQVVGRPVQLALSRADVFRIVGGRTLSQQRVALGAQRNGELQSLIHQGTTATTAHKEFAEQFTFPARHLYGAPNISIGQKIVDLDTVANTFMRAPGESIGTFALESALDELAHELQIDPIELRLRNQPEKDPTKGTEFSMRNLGEALRRGAERFGWKQSAPRSQRDGQWLIGRGVATAFYPYYRMQGASARAQIGADGRATIAAAAHEMGQGTATAQTQGAAQRLGLPVESVTFEYGDSALPRSTQAGGSSQTASVGAAVRAAIEQAQQELLKLASKDKNSPLHGLSWEQVEARDGGLFAIASENNGATGGETYREILARAGRDEVCVEAEAGSPTELMKYSMQSYGAQFCEVRVNEITGETRISRWLGCFDTGTILNPQTALSQFRGGIIMGIGMALTEETFFDTRRGRIANPTLAEYHLPVNLDVPKIEAMWLDVPDPHAPLGAHGIGEIGITGAAAAIANAVFNATGKRVRELPITLDKLL